MNKFITFLIGLILLTSLAFGQNYEVLWENSVAQGSLPGWFTTTSTERGFGFGTVGENDRLYIVSRSVGTKVQIYNAVNGDSVGVLDVTGVTGGTFVLNDADVSADGIIFACNLTTSANTSNFKVYRWDSEASTPALVIDYNDANGGRFGDKFTVVGSTADNSIAIYAAKASSTTIVKFTTADNGASFSAAEITVANAAGNTPSVGPKGTGDANFYVNGAGTSAYEYDASGALVSQIPGSILATGSNAIRYHSTGSHLYAVSFQYGQPKENARVIDVTFGNEAASSYLETPSLGANSNGNGTGDVALQDNGDGTFNVYVLSTNNGFGAYKVNMAPDLFFSEYLEGSSNNKAIELYNPLGTTVDLSYYRFERANNGSPVIQDSLEFSASGDTLASGAVYVVGNPQANQAILDVSDTTHTITFYNGDDYMAVAKNVGGTWVPIDAIGVLGEDPGSSWDVAGVPGATNEQTLVRKAKVNMGTTDWAASAGTDGTNSQWVVLERDNASFLGDHPALFARVQVVHNSADMNADTVDVWLNDALLLDDFAFRTASPFVTAPAGVEFDITIQPKNSADTTNGLWRKSYTLADGETYVLIASGIVIPTGYNPARTFDIAVFAAGQEAAGDGNNTDLLIYHGATDAPTVDVVAEGAGTIVDNLSYFEFTDSYLALPTADYRLSITDETGAVTVARYDAPLATLGLDGAAAVVFASGFLDPSNNNSGPAFGLYVALPGGGEAVALPPVVAGPVNVTFNVNSSTVEGFTDSTEVVQIRGGIQEVGGPGNNWDNTVLKWGNDSPEAANVGGDYWQATIVFPDSFIGKEVNWKIGATRTDDIGIVSDFWENGDNRVFVLPASDTTLGVGYVSNGFNPPYTPSDSIDVYFRVNMAANVQFNPTTTKVYMVGAFPGPDGADNMWVPDKYPLTRESGTSTYWGIHLPLAVAGAPYDSTMYRFTTGAWEGSENVRNTGMFPDNENRGVSIGLNDTTIAWVWWNNIPPVGPAGADTVQVKFTVDMTRAINDKGFVPGDSLEVRWGHEASAVFGTSALTNVFGTDKYSVTVDAQSVELGANLNYQYYIIPEGRDESREVYYDFSDPNQSTQERRKIVIPSPKPAEPFAINDDVDSQIDPRRMPTFPNSSPISNDVTVSWEVDLRPAYYQVKFGGDTLEGIQGTQSIGPDQLDSIFVWGVWMNGPAVGGWGNPGGDWGLGLRENEEKKLYDDASNGDLTAGDSIYTRQVMYYADPDSNDVVGQVYKFGIYGGDNEAGSGGFGNNHVANIDDSQPTTTIHTQFGSINPPFYSHWDFDGNMPTSVENLGDGIVIRDPNLHGNYPNPFNPTTTLTFELPKQMQVELIVFDVLGRKVIELINGVQREGVHQVVWNGADSRGYPVSSGVYFYRMVTENYERTMKMVLMR